MRRTFFSFMIVTLLLASGKVFAQYWGLVGLNKSRCRCSSIFSENKGTDSGQLPWSIITRGQTAETSRLKIKHVPLESGFRSIGMFLGERAPFCFYLAFQIIQFSSVRLVFTSVEIRK